MCQGRGQNLGASLWCSRSRLRPTIKGTWHNSPRYFGLEQLGCSRSFGFGFLAQLYVFDLCKLELRTFIQVKSTILSLLPPAFKKPRTIFVQECSHPWVLGISGLAVTGCNLRVSSRKRMFFATAVSLMKFVVLRLWLEFFATAPRYFVQSLGLYCGAMHSAWVFVELLA